MASPLAADAARASPAAADPSNGPSSGAATPSNPRLDKLLHKLLLPSTPSKDLISCFNGLAVVVEATPGAAETIVSAPEALATLQRHVTWEQPPEFKEAATGLIKALLANTADKSWLVQHGGIMGFLMREVSEPSSPTIRENANAVLLGLVTDPARVQRSRAVPETFVRSSGVPGASSSSSTSSTSFPFAAPFAAPDIDPMDVDKVISFAQRTLASGSALDLAHVGSLVSRSVFAQRSAPVKMARTKGFVSALVKVVQDYKIDGLRTGMLLALANICSEPSNKVLMMGTPGLASTAVGVVKESDAEDALVEAALRLLFSLSLEDRNKASLLRVAGLVRAVLDAARAPTRGYAVVERALDVLEALADEHVNAVPLLSEPGLVDTAVMHAKQSRSLGIRRVAFQLLVKTHMMRGEAMHLVPRVLNDPSNLPFFVRSTKSEDAKTRVSAAAMLCYLCIYPNTRPKLDTPEVLNALMGVMGAKGEDLDAVLHSATAVTELLQNKPSRVPPLNFYALENLINVLRWTVQSPHVERPLETTAFSMRLFVRDPRAKAFFYRRGLARDLLFAATFASARRDRGALREVALVLGDLAA